MIHTEMADVYGEVDGTIALYVTEDTIDGGVVICDGTREQANSTFLVYIENRLGVPYLIAWDDPDEFGNDPQYEIKLRG